MMVDKTGQIRIPDVGPVGVGGHNFSMVRKLIREKLSLIYQDLLSNTPKTFVNIQLGTIQPITVSVIGEVFAPGTYTLPGAATAFNALSLSGGPNIKGSFREIRVVRNGVVVNNLDRKSTRLNSSHVRISYAVFCLKKKK